MDVTVGSDGGGSQDPFATAFRRTSRATDWVHVDTVPLAFDGFHPQGLTRAGDRWFLSSVEIIEPTERHHRNRPGGHDRSPGKGFGHVFVLDGAGNLLEDLVLGGGDRYHPGGIDTDGCSVWVPVAEYRPGSATVLHRIDTATLAVDEAFAVDDHVGAVVRDPGSGLVHGVSWGSRQLYTWTLTGEEVDRRANRGHFVDYQDARAVGDGLALCSGVAVLPTASGAETELGGLALLELGTGALVHEVPVPRFSRAGHAVLRNAAHVELDGAVLRLWAAPDDGDEGEGTQLLVFEADVS
jgi:hypothetical protein